MHVSSKKNSSQHEIEPFLRVLHALRRRKGDRRAVSVSWRNHDGRSTYLLEVNLGPLSMDRSEIVLVVDRSRESIPRRFRPFVQTRPLRTSLLGERCVSDDVGGSV